MLTLVYKILNGSCPEYLRSIVTLNEPNQYNLRNPRTIHVPHTRLDTYFRSFIPLASRFWNDLSDDIKNAPSLITFKQLLNSKLERNKLFFYGERWPAVHHARMRMGCSKLKGDLCHNLHVISEATCPCGYHTEDAKHFLLDCPLYVSDRMYMLVSVIGVTDITLKNLLYGNDAITLDDNKIVFHAVHKFIDATKRFL